MEGSQKDSLVAAVDQAIDAMRITQRLFNLSDAHLLNGCLSWANAKDRTENDYAARATV